MEKLEIDHLFGGIYKGQKVLITGHTGFKGSWLSFWLKKLGADVYGLALDPPTQPNHFDLLNLDVNSYIQDIRDLQKVKEIVKAINPTIIFHLAAQPIVRFSYQDPVSTYMTNVMGTVNVLEAARNLSELKAVLVITSDKCYENKEWAWGYRENEPMGGRDPYSSSKGCVELITAAYRSSYFHPEKYGLEHRVLLASVRAGNVIGGGDWAEDRIVPDIVKATDRNEDVILRYPEATRPWQHVLEPLSGYLTLGWQLLKDKREFAESWNFGPAYGNNVTVLDLVRESQKNWNRINYLLDNKQHPHEAGVLMLDSTKAIKYLKWEPVWDFRKTIKYTITWYKEFYDNGNIISEDNLRQYINDAKVKSVSWCLQ
jgi:CDP-glucose 4,6-dehydratase